MPRRASEQPVDPIGASGSVGSVSDSDFQDEWGRHYVESVRRATQRAYDVAAWRSPEEVFSVLAEELRRRGIEPDPEAVFHSALLISRGMKPAVLRTAP
jgi:hypothetical protein